LENFVERASIEAKSDVMLADVNHYRVNELQAADITLRQIVQFTLRKRVKKGDLPEGKTENPSKYHRYFFRLPQSPRLHRVEKLMADLGN